jgi:hypothetical protein
MKKRMVRVVGTALAVATWMAAPRARADDLSFLPGLVSSLAAGPLAVAGIVVAIGNALSDGEDGKPTVGWRVSGYIIGGLNLAAGIVTLALSAQSRGPCQNTCDGAAFPLGIVIGIASLAIGGLDIGVTLYRGSRSDRPSTRISLVPTTGVGARGAPFGGLGIRVASF